MPSTIYQMKEPTFLELRQKSSPKPALSTLRMLSIFRHLAELGARIAKTHYGNQEVSGLNQCVTVLEDSKVLLEWMLVPCKVTFFAKTYFKLEKAYHALSSLHPPAKYREQAARVFNLSVTLFATFLSVFLKGILQPLVLIYKKMNWKQHVFLKRSCQIFSIVGSLLRLTVLSSKIIHKKFKYERPISLVLELLEFLIRSLKLAHVRVHPLVLLSVVSLKGLIDLCKGWCLAGNGL